MDKKTIIQLANDNEVKLIAFLYCDNGGIIRGKCSHISSLEKHIESGIGMSVAMPAMSSIDTLQDIEGKGAIGEIRLVPDLDTFKILPYAPKWATMMCEMQSLDHQSWSACTRSFLKRMIARASSMGLRIKASFEPEWTLAVEQENGEFEPLDKCLCYSSIGLIKPRKVIEDIVIALEAQNIQIEQYYPELGHGQQELSIRYDDALAAADNQILYRETVRNIAEEHGCIASFAPKPFVDQAGNGCHIHLSAWNLDDDTNLFHASSGKAHLSKIADQFIAGVLYHMRGLVALTCSSVNSYRRLKPRSWSSAFACYGPDNREAVIRIPSTFWEREVSSSNIELKASDSSANPYIALGAMIAAGLHGIEDGLELNDDLLIETDPATLSKEELDTRGIYRLPETLSEAVDALEQDPVLSEALGVDLLQSFIAVRRGEIQYYSKYDDEHEFKSHFYKY